MSHLGVSGVLKTLLNKGANVHNESGRYGSALSAALHNGHEEVEQLLLETGVNVNAEVTNETDFTVMHCQQRRGVAIAGWKRYAGKRGRC